MADWYYAKDGQQYGPVSAQQLRQMAAAGQLTPDDLVFQEGGTQWVAASTVKGLFAGAQAAPAPGPAATRGAPARGGAAGSFAFDEKAPEPLEDDYDRPTRGGGRGGYQGGGGFADLLMFRRMIAPWVIIVLFWLGVVGVILVGLFGIVSSFRFGAMAIVMAFVSFLLGTPLAILFIRVYAEVVIVFFRIHETLLDIRGTLEKQKDR